MNLDFHGAYSFTFNFWILISNGFLHSLAVNPKKTLITVRSVRETLYFTSQDGHCHFE